MDNREPLSDDRDSRQPSRDVGRPDEDMSASRERSVMLLFGRLSCIIGLVIGVFSIAAVFLLDSTANVSAPAVGAALGILGYFLGSRRLGTATVLICVAALFLGLAASQGLIPGIDATDRTLPANEPAVE